MKQMTAQELEQLSNKAQQYAAIADLLSTNDFFKVHFLKFLDDQIADAQKAYNCADLRDNIGAAALQGGLARLCNLKETIDLIPEKAKNLAQRVAAGRENAERVAIRQRTESTAPTLRMPI